MQKSVKTRKERMVITCSARAVSVRIGQISTTDVGTDCMFPAYCTSVKIIQEGAIRPNVSEDECETALTYAHLVCNAFIKGVVKLRVPPHLVPEDDGR